MTSICAPTLIRIESNNEKLIDVQVPVSLKEHPIKKNLKQLKDYRSLISPGAYSYTPQNNSHNFNSFSDIVP